jgi:phospholipid transport system substrate-binding protein
MGSGKIRIMISRRSFVAVSLAALATPARAEHPSIQFMNQMGKDMLHASRIGTVSAFQRVIQRYADVKGISDYSLGTYAVDGGQKPQYLRGVVTFMSRYFAEQARNYPVAKYEIGEATVAENKDVLVDSKVYMMAGQTYSVSWRLSWINGQYKITDAKFLGFSMTYQQRSLFTSFVAKNNGDVGKLITALNR